MVAEMESSSFSSHLPYNELSYKGKECCLPPSCFGKRFMEDSRRSWVLPTPVTARGKQQPQQRHMNGFPRQEMVFATKGAREREICMECNKSCSEYIAH